MSDDECLALLEKTIEDHDPESLDQVAWLIGRLAVPIE
jgi:predicted transcriptional regulator